MTKPKVSYTCTECGAVSPKWSGQCTDCEAWNSLLEVAVSPKSSTLSPRFKGYTGLAEEGVVDLMSVPTHQEIRMSSGLSELDRVLGGGLVSGSVVLIGGDPGIGKSTVLLQTLASLCVDTQAFYITGEV